MPFPLCQACLPRVVVAVVECLGLASAGYLRLLASIENNKAEGGAAVGAGKKEGRKGGRCPYAHIAYRGFIWSSDDALCRVVVIDEDTSRSICRDTVNLCSKREGEVGQEQG